MTTTRRQFLIGAASSVATTLLVGSGCGPSDSEGMSKTKKQDKPEPPPDVDPTELPEAELGLDRILDIFFEDANMEGIRTIGKEYLRRFDGAEVAVETLSQTVEPIADLEEMEEATTTLDESITDDFAGLEVVDVGGWQLARTEGNLCGLAYYLDNGEALS